MTLHDIPLAAREYIAQIPEIKALVTAGLIGRGEIFTDGWIFAYKPQRVTIEKYSHRAMIVVNSDDQWAPMNEYGTAQFPRLFVDIWASPTRNSDGSENKPDADELIRRVMAAMMPHLHTVNIAVPVGSPDFMGPDGGTRMWGTAAQIASREGLPIYGSHNLDGPKFSDVANGNGARMASWTFGISTS